MENNQQSSSKTSTSEQDEKTSFKNSQPGQQLPSGNNSTDAGSKSSTENEQHSESGQLEKENETLGTP